MSGHAVSGRTPRRVRVTVAGREPLVFELDPPSDPLSSPPTGQPALPNGHKSVPPVRPLPPTPSDLVRGATRLEVVVDGWCFQVTIEDAARAALRDRAGRLATRSGGGAGQIVRAQIPGRVVRVDVSPGDRVEVGQRLLSIEAMKMENDLRAAASGIVDRVSVAPGAAVERGQELVVIS